MCRTGWATLISVSATGLDGLLLAIEAFAAFRLVAGHRLAAGRR